jgi:hypothetical protein
MYSRTIDSVFHLTTRRLARRIRGRWAVTPDGHASGIPADDLPGSIQPEEAGNIFRAASGIGNGIWNHRVDGYPVAYRVKDLGMQNSGWSATGSIQYDVQ